MTAARVGGGRIEAGLVGLAGFHGLGEGVVDFEDGVFGDVAAGFDHLAGGVLFGGAGLVLALHDGEGVHDVGHRVAGGGERFGQRFGLFAPLGFGAELEVEEGGVQLAAEQQAALLVPTERRAAPPAVLRECLQIPRRIVQFKNTFTQPVSHYQSANCFRLERV